MCDRSDGEKAIKPKTMGSCYFLDGTVMKASVSQLKTFCRDKRINTAGYCEKSDFQGAVIRYIKALHRENVANGVVEAKKPVAAAAAGDHTSNVSSEDGDSDSCSSSDDDYDMPQLSTAGGIDSKAQEDKKNDTMKVALPPLLLRRFHAHHQVFLLFVYVTVWSCMPLWSSVL